MDFAPLLKTARKSSGLTQAQVAKASGVSRSAVIDLEGGRGTMRTLTEVAAVVEFRISGLSHGGSFGDQVKSRRARLKWTQRKLATETNLTLPTIRAVENNRANLDSFAKVVAVIGDDPRPRKAERFHWKGGQRDVRHTPPNIIEAIVSSFGAIDCDPCHDPESHVCPTQLGITKEMDGLKTRWRGDVAFVNPPYSNLPACLRRISEALANNEVQTVIGLVPLRSDTRVFQDHILDAADILFPRGRIRFYEKEKELGDAPFPVVFPIWNADPIQIKTFANAIDAVWMAKQ